MKKYKRLLVASILLIACALSIPLFTSGLVTSVALVYPQYTTISEDVAVSGTVEEMVKKEMFVEIPLVPDQVYVREGDHVETRDVIASIDVAATEKALYDLLGSANLIPAEYRELLSSISVSKELVESIIPTVITASASGTITSLELISGVIVMPKTVICTISILDQLQARMSVSEVDANKIKQGDLVFFQASATQQETYQGAVEQIAPAASQVLVGTSQQTVVNFTVLPARVYEQLKPGYSITGIVKKSDGRQVLSLPYEAIQQDENNMEYVYVYHEGKPVKTPVETGEELASAVEILGGVSLSDPVIVNPLDIKSETGRIVPVG